MQKRADTYSDGLEAILGKYRDSFGNKIFREESPDEDPLMAVFGLTQAAKASNRQYWGRELGFCWQLLITELCRQFADEFGSAIKDNRDEICDLTVGNDAIDTKYRIGSGDSGTLKKFEDYAARIKKRKMRPVLLILRTDNLAAALSKCSDWKIVMGEEAFAYVEQLTRIDLKSWLVARCGKFDHSIVTAAEAGRASELDLFKDLK